MNERLRAAWRTPKGNVAIFEFRNGTSDWNTLQSCTAEDEYGLRALRLSGVALDIGAHIGGVSIGLAIDNPDLRVIAVEAVPDNAALLEHNATLNGVADRLTVLNAAAAAPGVDSVVINYGYRGNEAAEHHAWIGNITMLEGQGGRPDHDEVRVPGVSLTGLFALAPEPVSFAKVDCEGGEYGFLSDPAVRFLPRIVGEYHPLGPDPSGAEAKRIFRRSDLVALLAPTHDLTFPPVNVATDPERGPGGFIATLRVPHG